MIGPDLIGRRVRLRPLREDDLDRRVVWMQDVEIQELFTGKRLAKAYTRFDAFQWRLSLESDGAAVVYAIDYGTGRHIGDVDIHGIDRRDGSARLSILIGERSAWGSGYGTDAIEALLRYAFDDLGLAEVRLRVFNFNKRAIRCYEKCGFVVTGGSVTSAPDLGAGFGVQPQHSWGEAETFMAISRERFMALHPDVETLRAA